MSKWQSWLAMAVQQPHVLHGSAVTLPRNISKNEMESFETELKGMGMRLTGLG